ncbi:MAG: two-component regulator propeller domain-containing protein [Bacteroides sp.]|nr:two-component regulator propeller domain-containing protein [Bacteroides sp.]
MRILFLFVLLCAAYLLPTSATVDVRSTHFNTSDGLANNTVRNIFQDSKGFIWFATLNGLSRFDGNSFTNYYPREGVPALIDYRVRKMQEDCYGLIWIDVFSERQCCFDLKRGRFVDFTGCGEYDQPYFGTTQTSTGDIWMVHNKNGCRRIRYDEDGTFSSVAFRKEDGNLTFQDVSRVFEDERGRIWIIASEGVEQVMGDSVKMTLHISGASPVNIGNTLFFIDSDGRIWMEAGGNDFKVVASLPANSSNADIRTMLLKDELYIFTSSGGYVFHWRTNSLQKVEGLLDIRNASVAQDSRGNYWIYNNTGVVHYVNAQTGVVKELCLIPKEKMQYIDFERYRFVHDSRDVIWISTYGNGLFAYNAQTDELQHFTAEMNSFSCISSNYLLDVMEDRSGGIWVSSEFSGVSRLTVLNEGASYVYPEGYLEVDDRSNMVRMIARLNDGHTYVGTRRGGVHVYDKEMRLLEKQAYRSNIYSMIRDKKGSLWLGSRAEGVCVGDVWYRNQPDDSTSLSGNQVFSMCEDRKGRIWVGTLNGGLNLAVKGRDGKYSFRHFLNKNYYQQQIRTISEDRNGYIWVGTSEGVCVFQPDSLLNNPNAYLTFNRQNGRLLSNEVKSFCLDSKGRMWIATSGAGLTVCQPGGDYANLTFECYDISDGLVNNMVQSIVEDRQGRIWVSTEYGISCLDVDRMIFENYFFSSHTLGNTYSENSGCMAEDGRIMFGSGYGLLVIEPDQTGYKRMARVPVVTLTGLKINGMLVQSDEADSPLQSDIAYTDRIELEHHQNSFEVAFSIFDYSQDGTVKYMYRLDNYDDWSTPSALNFAIYKNLDPGKYQLRIKACNGVGVWGEHETVLDITIHPPFWRSGWAYFIYTVLVLLVIYVLLRMLQQLNALRNRIVVEKQLTEYKLRFFTNISHEFRTPLTLIQGSLERMSESTNPKDMAYFLKTANKSTKRMLRLVNQLLEFRKMQNNKLALSLEETDVIGFLYEIFLSFKDTADAKKMAFSFVSSQESYRMFIDKEKLDKVSYNLLSNAFKYTPSGGKIIFSATVNVAANKLIISVADNGVGIPKEKRGELFNRFMQSSFSGNSIGVGLHLTQELVQVHKGNIAYSENEGGGSVFTVSLPTDASVYEEKDFLLPSQLLVEESQQHRKDAISETLVEDDDNAVQLPAALSEPLNKRRVLIIEDDNDVREFLQKEIEPYFEVVTEADGISGLERARKFDADLIVCDVLMPGMNGFEVTRRLKNDFDTSHIPVILLTALSSEDKLLEGLESGADAYITKPFSPKLLLTRIFKLIEQRDKLREKFGKDPNMVRPAICSSQSDKDFADRLQKIMDKQIGNTEFSIDEFAGMMNLGRTIFYRKVRGVTGYTPNEYMRIVRMKKAVELLEEGTYNISEISYKVGISDPLYFSRCFKQQFGVTPSAYQRGERAAE